MRADMFPGVVRRYVSVCLLLKLGAMADGRLGFGGPCDAWSREEDGPCSDACLSLVSMSGHVGVSKADLCQEHVVLVSGRARPAEGRNEGRRGIGYSERGMMGSTALKILRSESQLGWAQGLSSLSCCCHPRLI